MEQKKVLNRKDITMLNKIIIICFIIFNLSACNKDKNIYVELYTKYDKYEKAKKLYTFKIDSVNVIDSVSWRLYFQIQDSFMINHYLFGVGIDFVKIKQGDKIVRVKAKSPASSFLEKDYPVNYAWLNPFRENKGNIFNYNGMKVSCLYNSEEYFMLKEIFSKYALSFQANSTKNFRISGK